MEAVRESAPSPLSYAPSVPETDTVSDGRPWYAGVTGYQWLVLLIASAGWAFDAFEGQLYNITRNDLLRELIPNDLAGQKFWGEFFISAFLLGGTLGGIVFGSVADRIGRKPAMALSILFYSVFSGLTYFATEVWQVAALRFLVALGVGGEWAVAAALVAEVFPARARARAGGIFHATSVFGTWIAALAGLLVGTHWRYAYIIGVVPALLVLWVRVSIKEPERWEKTAHDSNRRRGSFKDLFGSPIWARHAILGMLLATVGLATFWAVVVAGQDLTLNLLKQIGTDPDKAAFDAKVAFGYVQAAGMGAGFLCFGPVAERIGRRGTFILWHVCAVLIVPITCYAPQSYFQMLLLLPVYGFFTGGLHAGYAIYFPELFPDHLRATGAGICFNGGRLLAAGLLSLSGKLKAEMDLRQAVTMLAGLYLLGVVLLLFMPETKGKPLPT